MLQRLRFFSLPGLLLLSLVACREVAPHETLDGNWRLVAYESLDDEWHLSEPDHIARSIRIRCEDNGRQGRFDGETVTNRIYGNYTLTPGGSIDFQDVGGGLRGEPAWGEDFWETLDLVHSYSRGPELLTLSTDSLRLVLVRE